MLGLVKDAQEFLAIRRESPCVARTPFYKRVLFSFQRAFALRVVLHCHRMVC